MYSTSFSVLAFPSTVVLSTLITSQSLISAATDVQVVSATIVAEEGPAMAATSDITLGAGVTAGGSSSGLEAEVGTPFTLLITARDVFSHARSTGGDGFTATLAEPDSGVVSVQDTNDGEYVVTVTPRVVRPLVVDIALRGARLQHSPVVVDVVSPACHTGTMQLDATATLCVCRAGFEVPSRGNATGGNANATTVPRCELCKAGYFSPTPELGSCALCPEQHFSYRGASACSACPDKGVTCWGGIVKPLNGYWVEYPNEVRNTA